MAQPDRLERVTALLLVLLDTNRPLSLREIAEQKMKDMNANDIEGAVRMLAGSARSMGLTVVEG